MVFSLEILGKCGRGRTTGAARWSANPASFCKIIYRLLEYAISPTPTLLKDTLLKIWLWKILFQKIHFWRKAQSLLEKKHSARSQFVLVQMTCNNTAKVEPQLAFLEKVDLSRDPVSSLPARAARPPMTDGSIRPTRTSFSSWASTLDENLLTFCRDNREKYLIVQFQQLSNPGEIFLEATQLGWNARSSL